MVAIINMHAEWHEVTSPPPHVLKWCVNSVEILLFARIPHWSPAFLVLLPPPKLMVLSHSTSLLVAKIIFYGVKRSCRGVATSSVEFDNFQELQIF